MRTNDLTLQDPECINTIGYRKVPRKPILYGTTSQLSNDLNLKNLSELSTLLISFEAQDPFFPKQSAQRKKNRRYLTLFKQSVELM